MTVLLNEESSNQTVKAICFIEKLSPVEIDSSRMTINVCLNGTVFEATKLPRDEFLNEPSVDKK